MQNKEEKDDNIITPSVEISDLSPPLPQSYDDLREIDESAGANQQLYIIYRHRLETIERNAEGQRHPQVFSLVPPRL